MIPNGFVQELLARTEIVDIVGRHVELKKAGIHHKGLCPFHAEKSPSFTVSPSRQTYHCFGCGAHGNAVGFLMEHLGLGFPDAVGDLAAQAGVAVPEDERSDAERETSAAAKQRLGTLHDVLAKAADHYKARLKDSARAVDYLKRRGLSGDIAARFGLGYATDGWRGLASGFPAYDDPLLEEAGLVLCTDDGPERKRYDRFRDRIMFPIRSVQGHVIGFGGRVLDKGEPKYLNSPETAVFSKGRELYGLFEARQAIRQAGHAIVVEGYMDVVALAQLGLPQAVATLGTACTAEHVQKLFRHTDSIVFSFDGDAAGRRAAGRALEAALPHVNDVRSARFLMLPPEHDPDSFVRANGREAFEQLVAEATPLSRWFIAVAGEQCDLGLAEGKSRLLAQARPLWNLLEDGTFKRQMLAEIALEGGLNVEELAGLWTAAARRQLGRAPAADGAGVRKDASPHSARSAHPARSARRDAATLLERALWLLLHRLDTWPAVDSAAQEVLTAQAAPYGGLFRCVERCQMDHGVLPPHEVLAELQSAGAHEGPTWSAVVERIARLHAPEMADDALQELKIVVDRLRLQAVEDELTLLFESGVSSPDAQARGAVLIKSQSRLKAHLSAVFGAH